jgi:hypothetical protein
VHATASFLAISTHATSPSRRSLLLRDILLLLLLLLVIVKVEVQQVVRVHGHAAVGLVLLVNRSDEVTTVEVVGAT